jgi:hypothetical protein
MNSTTFAELKLIFIGFASGYIGAPELSDNGIEHTSAMSAQVALHCTALL